MIKGAALPLESYRLAQYSAGIPCYVCEHENNLDNELCSQCAAPMALAHQAKCQKVHPRMVAVVGGSGVGKTVYLGMLMDILSRRTDGLQLAARGAFSITLQQTTVAALARNEFPDKTPNEPDRWNWVHCQVRQPRQRHPLELIMPDMAGEAILYEVDHPRSYRAIRALLEKCVGAMLLVDGVKLRDGSLDQDFLTMKLISYLSELDQDPKRGWSNRPVALVFTKADQCDGWAADPGACAERHARRLWQQCRERFGRHRFFAAGVAGSCAWRQAPKGGRVLVPLRIEPHGIVEPFAWLLEQIGHP